MKCASRLRTAFSAVAGLAFGAAVVTGPVGTEAADFSGERIELIVPYGEGGGSTIHARLFAPMLEKHLPGHPTIIVRNIPGGGSVKGINHFYRHARPDGLMIASTGTGTFFQYILQDSAVQYPLPKFIPFLTSPFGLVVYGRKDFGLTGDPMHDIRALQEKQPIYGGASATSSDLPALYALDMLGIKVKTVFGMSNGEARAAFERGEISLNYDNAASWNEAVKPLVDDGVAVPLFTLGFEDENGEIIRDPMLPDVPTFLELYKKVHGKDLTGEARAVWDALFNIRVMGSKMFVLPPDTPEDIVKTYQGAMAEALASPDMQSKQAKLVLGEYPQRTGQVSMRILKTAADMDDEARRWLKDWLHETHGVE